MNLLIKSKQLSSKSEYYKMHENCKDELLCEVFNELNKEFFNNELDLNKLMIRWKQDIEVIDGWWGLCLGYRIVVLKRFINGMDIRDRKYILSLKKLLYHELLHAYLQERSVGHQGDFFKLYNEFKVTYHSDLGKMGKKEKPVKLNLSEEEKAFLDKFRDKEQ